MKTTTLARDGVPFAECVTIDWRETAERRLTKLTDAEHDLAVVRDRLDYLQSNYRLLLQQSEQRLVRIRELERELEELNAAHSRFFGDFRRRLAALRPRIKALILFAIGLILRVPLARPVVRIVLRAFPKLGDKLRARFLTSGQSE
ncbi:hypothetical protein EO087_14085 [Dyella sp. M7H15-1]|uniref:hypothetical protein n=1 Tax=Dyella sp. M7H15-1 TaxID=2501295 RepID=UPI001004DC7E|nr:hypothetical protein [Dyella sp. M7H15-1]QAU24984.1 hypothetical protein EO087_14085 [Dyella sp. M7H15-1]